MLPCQHTPPSHAHPPISGKGTPKRYSLHLAHHHHQRDGQNHHHTPSSPTMNHKRHQPQGRHPPFARSLHHMSQNQRKPANVPPRRKRSRSPRRGNALISHAEVSSHLSRVIQNQQNCPVNHHRAPVILNLSQIRTPMLDLTPARSYVSGLPLGLQCTRN